VIKIIATKPVKARNIVNARNIEGGGNAIFTMVGDRNKVKNENMEASQIPKRLFAFFRIPLKFGSRRPKTNFVMVVELKTAPAAVAKLSNTG